MAPNSNQFLNPPTQFALKQPAPGQWMPNVPENCIRLHAGYPAPSLIPIDGIQQATAKLFANEGTNPMQYAGSLSADALRTWVKGRLADRGMDSNNDGLLVTSGAIQSIDLLARTLLERQSGVMVESASYMEALEIFRNYTDDIIPLPIDEHGLQVVALQQLLEQRNRNNIPLPKLLYTIPTFQNPTGRTLSLGRRKQLLELAKTYHFIILEDDAYGELSFTSPLPTLKSMDADGVVVHVGSLSKVLAPGVRIGWTMGPQWVIDAMSWFKKDLDHPFVEAVVATHLQAVDWSEHLTRIQATYRRRRDTMLQALRQFMPAHISFTEPDGGYFTWLHVPNVDTSNLLELAMAHGVSFIPGEHFFVDGDMGKPFLRLSYSFVDPDQIVRGVQILAEVIQSQKM